MDKNQDAGKRHQPERTGRRNGNTPGQDQRGYHREAIRKEVYHSADPGTGRKHG